jgi:hypothetical protein
MDNDYRQRLMLARRVLDQQHAKFAERARGGGNRSGKKETEQRDEIRQLPSRPLKESTR